MQACHQRRRCQQDVCQWRRSSTADVEPMLASRGQVTTWAEPTATGWLQPGQV
jgi:hypothetical protein